MAPLKNPCVFCDVTAPKSGTIRCICRDCIWSNFSDYDWSTVKQRQEINETACFICLKRKSYTTCVVMCDGCCETSDSIVQVNPVFQPDLPNNN